MDGATETREQAAVVIREAKEADHAFIYATWLKSFLYGDDSPMARVPQDEYYHYEHKIIEKWLKLGRAIVAVPESEPTVLCGYSVGGNTVVHYCYVKPAFRKMGLACRLVEALIGKPGHEEKPRFTHWTGSAHWLERKWPSARYNPYLN